MRNLAVSRSLPLFLGLAVLSIPCWAAQSGAPAQSDSKPAAQAKSEATAPAAKADGQPASPEVCKGCHVAEYDSWEKSPHWKTMLNKSAGPLHQGCQGCHGSAAAHLADPTDTSKLFKFESAPAKEIINQCLGCHSKDMEQAHALNSVHTKNGVACTACHSPHHSTQPRFLLAKAQPELCYTCHLAKKAEFAMPFHHRVNEGLIQCTDCHNPHGTEGSKQVRMASTQDEVCYKCHVDKQGPFVYEHPPVKIDGCTSCHQVHGGPNPHMLKVSNVNLLCLQCHTDSSFSTAPGAPSFHNQASFFQACTLCHSQIHGSNFSSTFFK
jgi:DmsE family decaheme c-type cytochrome